MALVHESTCHHAPRTEYLISDTFLMVFLPRKTYSPKITGTKTDFTKRPLLSRLRRRFAPLRGTCRRFAPLRGSA